MDEASDDSVVAVSLVVFEMMAERSRRVTRALVAGWAASVAVMAAVMAYVAAM